MGGTAGSTLLGLRVGRNGTHLILCAAKTGDKMHVVMGTVGNAMLLSGAARVSPSRPFVAAFTTRKLGRRRMYTRIHSGRKRVLLSCRTSGPRVEPIPSPTGTTGSPRGVTSIRRLFLAKLRLRRCHRTACGPVSCCVRTLEHRPKSMHYGGTIKLLLVHGKRFTVTRDCFQGTIRALARHGPGPCSNRPCCGLN